jgi:hypothetical protein
LIVFAVFARGFDDNIAMLARLLSLDGASMNPYNAAILSGLPIGAIAASFLALLRETAVAVNVAANMYVEVLVQYEAISSSL